MMDVNALYDMLNNEQEQFKDFEASSLYCPKCKIARPVRKRLLLVLSDGDLYEYRCTKCSETLGKQKDTRQNPGIII